MLNAAFPVFNGLGVLFVLIPSGWHWRVRNTGTLLFGFWCILASFPLFVNSLIWYDTVRIVAPVWCDITTKLQVGANVGLAAAALCITRQLESIAAARQISLTHQDRRRRLTIDLCLGLGLPVFVMIAHVVVQGHRFDILERVGCTPTVYWSYPALFLVILWPVCLYIVSAVYSALALRLFIIRRYQFAKILESSQSAITTSRFLRLMALATVQIAFNLPLVIYALAKDFAFVPLRPYVSWGYVHHDFGYIGITTLAERLSVPASQQILAELNNWVYAVSCALFFLFFGLGEESMASYSRWWAAATFYLRSCVKRVSGRSLTTSSVLSRDGITRIGLPRYGASSTEVDKEDFCESGIDVLEGPRDGVHVVVQKQDYHSL